MNAAGTPPRGQAFQMNEAYWAKHPDGPFATLIRVAATYCDPEQDADAYDDLKHLAQQADDPEMRVFKTELLRALTDPSQLPGDELHWAVGYSDGSPEKFLRRLWRDLYGGESIAPWLRSRLPTVIRAHGTAGADH